MISAQQPVRKPNIILIVSDDFGYGDAGVYGGGPNRGMPKGMLSGKAAQKATEEFQVKGEDVNTPEKGVVSIPFHDEYIEKAAIEYLDNAGKSG